MPANLDVPRYLPVTTESLRRINEFLVSKDELTNKLEDQIKGIRSDVDRFIEFVVNENLFDDLTGMKRVLETHRESVYEVLKQKADAEVWKSAFISSRARIHSNMHGEEILNLQNIGQYQQSEELGFYELIKKEYDQSKDMDAQTNQFEAYLKNQDLYQFIKNISFILDHPEDPLPDEVEDEEISVAGGKISLKDPISLNYFVEPMKSRRCNHVYEKEHILVALAQEGSGNQCPVSGCSNRMSSRDLVPDEMMTIRVKVYQARGVAASDNLEVVL